MANVSEVDWFITVQLQHSKTQAIVTKLTVGAAHRNFRADYKIKIGQ